MSTPSTWLIHIIFFYKKHASPDWLNWSRWILNRYMWCENAFSTFSFILYKYLGMKASRVWFICKFWFCFCFADFPKIWFLLKLLTWGKKTERSTRRGHIIMKLDKEINIPLGSNWDQQKHIHYHFVKKS